MASGRSESGAFIESNIGKSITKSFPKQTEHMFYSYGSKLCVTRQCEKYLWDFFGEKSGFRLTWSALLPIIKAT